VRVALQLAELHELERLASEASARGAHATARSWRQRARALREELRES
jgi:hypothetical protein